MLFLDAIYLPVRPSGRKEGVMFAWGIAADAPGLASAVEEIWPRGSYLVVR